MGGIEGGLFFDLEKTIGNYGDRKKAAKEIDVYFLLILKRKLVFVNELWDFVGNELNIFEHLDLDD